MAQTARETFENVGSVLSRDGQFLSLCQEANILYSADRFEPDKDESSPIEKYMVSKLAGGWLMPWWYQWFYDIKPAEVNRYLLRALFQFRDWKEGATLTLRPGEKALMMLFWRRESEPIFSYFAAYNPIGILLRRTYAVYFGVSGETPGWFWQFQRRFGSFVNWALGNKPAEVSVTRSENGYEIKQGINVTVSHTRLNEAIQKHAETSWWQVLKKRALKREYPFDIPTLSQAWDYHWLKKEKEYHEKEKEKEEVEEDCIENPKKELSWKSAATKSLRDSVLILVDNAPCKMGDVYQFQYKNFKRYIDALRNIVNDENPGEFYNRLKAVKQAWGKNIAKHQKIILILKERVSTLEPSVAWQENLERFQILDRLGKETWAEVIAQVKEKFAQNLLDIKCVQVDLQQLTMKTYAEMRAIYDSMTKPVDIDIDAFQLKADLLIEGYITETDGMDFEAVKSLVDENSKIIKSLNETKEAFSKRLGENLSAFKTAVVRTPIAPSQTAPVTLCDEIPLEDRVYSFKAQHSYKLLGVAPGALRAALNTAYRFRALKCHPDKNPNGRQDFEDLGLAHIFLTEEGGEKEYVHKSKANDYAFILRNNLQSTAFNKEIEKRNWAMLRELNKTIDNIMETSATLSREMKKHFKNIDAWVNEMSEYYRGANLELKNIGEAMAETSRAYKQMRQKLEQREQEFNQREQKLDQREQKLDKIKQLGEETRQQFNELVPEMQKLLAAYNKDKKPEDQLHYNAPQTSNVAEESQETASSNRSSIGSMTSNPLTVSYSSDTDNANPQHSNKKVLEVT